MNGKAAKMIADRRGSARDKRLFKRMTHTEKGKVRAAHEEGLYPGVPFESFVAMVLTDA